VHLLVNYPPKIAVAGRLDDKDAAAVAAYFESLGHAKL
jgi:hypothetical protein